jgi:hypothetical protein
MSRIVEIKWSDESPFDSVADEDLGIHILGGEPGRLFAHVSDALIERLRQAGFEVNVLFESVEEYVAAFGGNQDQKE